MHPNSITEAETRAVQRMLMVMNAAASARTTDGLQTPYPTHSLYLRVLGLSHLSEIKRFKKRTESVLWPVLDLINSLALHADISIYSQLNSPPCVS